MNNMARFLLFLMVGLLASQVCQADPLNGAIDTQDVIEVLLILLAALLVFVAAPIVSYLNYKRSSKQLTYTGWMLAIVTKIAIIYFITRSGDMYYKQLATLVGFLPNISLYMLLLKAEKALMKWWYMLTVFVRCILGILLMNNVLSLLLFRILFGSNVPLLQAFSHLISFGITVWFVFQFIQSSKDKGLVNEIGLKHSFLFGAAVSIGLVMNNMFFVILSVLRSEGNNFSEIANVVFSMHHNTMLISANIMLSGVVAFGLYKQLGKRTAR